MAHYMIVRRAVKSGKTTLKKVEAQGLILPADKGGRRPSTLSKRLTAAITK
jgi:hypothetical protein